MSGPDFDRMSKDEVVTWFDASDGVVSPAADGPMAMISIRLPVAMVEGRKRRITERERGRIIALTCSDPPGRAQRMPDGDLHTADETGPPQWTLNSLTETARAEGIQVRRMALTWRPPRRLTLVHAQEQHAQAAEDPGLLAAAGVVQGRFERLDRHAVHPDRYLAGTDGWNPIH